MMKHLPRKSIKLYVLFLLIGTLSLSAFHNTCSAQVKNPSTAYTTLIQQADQALAAKDYAGALQLYGKASRAKPELTYAQGKIAEINATLDANADTRSQLFEDIILKAENYYKQKSYPQAKTEFQKALLIDHSAQYPKDRLAEISALYTDPDDLAYYNDAVANGDKAMAASQFDQAVQYYETALTVKPDAKVVKDKIKSTKEKQADFKLRTELAAKNIAVADNLMQSGKRPEARAEYLKALDQTPDNQYAKQKIQEIDTYTGNAKAEQENYDKVIEQADQFYIKRDFASARLKYQEALKVKPEARYPKEMLEKTKTGEGQLQSEQQKYDAAILSAENLLKTSDYEAAINGFKSAAEIKPTETYPKTKIAEIEKLVADQASRKQNYDLAIKNGDQAFADKKYDIASGQYRNALLLIPGEKYPTEKIAEITALTGKQKEADENYKKLVADADKLFKQEKFEDAVSTYTKALAFKPEEAYPQQKITEAQGKIAASKSKEENYAAAVAVGDQLLSESKYNDALDAYEKALSIKRAEEYPISKIAEINLALTKQKSETDKYTQAIDKGSKAMATGNTTLALASFQQASAIKPNEQYPKDKIAEINTAVASQQQKEGKYKTTLAEADKLFATKEYEKAKTLYNEAAELKKDGKYPQDQVVKIDKILDDLHSADENYNQAIAEGDENYKNQKLPEALTAYKKAAGLKSTEAYPTSQIEKINTQVAEQKKLENDFMLKIGAADKLLATKKYEEAIAIYKEALTLKPAEKYASDKIAEIEKQIADQKSLDESYSKAIAEGEKFIADKDYAKALATFSSASALKPAEAYPKQKSAEMQAILDKDKAESQLYQEAVAQGDNSLAAQKYTESIEAYQRALKIRPSENYPQDQVTKINQIIAEQKKLDADYQKLLTDADAQFKSANYKESRALYNNAATLKSAEKLPATKIAEINVILTGIEKNEQDYTSALSKGDAFFADKNYTEALVSYTAASVIKPTENYPKSQINKINALVAEQAKKDDNFLAAVASADQFFDAKKYTEAIGAYRKAMDIKPSEKYPSDRISEAEKQIAEFNAKKSAYDQAIAEGDKKLASKEYETALAAFKTANSAVPDEIYAKQKVVEVQAILDKIKAENDRYVETIAAADKFYQVEKYREALEPYQTATTIKPAEKYPQEQIILINQRLAELKKADNDYQKIISDAGTLFAAGKYDEARGLYTNASVLKPSEKLPKDKLAEIDAILAGLKLKDENYTQAINKASEFYTAKNLAAAEQSYEEAQAIKPAEKYPQDRIAAIKAELKAIDDSYSKAIELGDSKLASNNFTDALNAYQNALEIKPNEQYPKSKIAEINSSVVAQKEELDKMYNSYVSKGDELASAKAYAGAKSAYTKAAGIKPTEVYPKQRLTEITKTMEEIELARRAEYTKALGEADKLYNSKIFDQAIDAYDAASLINPGDPYPSTQVSKIRKYMTDHAIQDLSSQTLTINEGDEKKFTFSAIEPRLRKNNYILLKARSTGKSTPKVYLNYGKDGQKNGGIVLRSLNKSTINDYLIRISVQDKWYREDNNWISLFVETGSIEITKVQIAAGD